MSYSNRNFKNNIDDLYKHSDPKIEFGGGQCFGLAATYLQCLLSHGNAKIFFEHRALWCHKSWEYKKTTYTSMAKLATAVTDSSSEMAMAAAAAPVAKKITPSAPVIDEPVRPSETPRTINDTFTLEISALTTFAHIHAVKQSANSAFMYEIFTDEILVDANQLSRYIVSLTKILSKKCSLFGLLVSTKQHTLAVHPDDKEGYSIYDQSSWEIKGCRQQTIGKGIIGSLLASYPPLTAAPPARTPTTVPSVKPYQVKHAKTILDTLAFADTMVTYQGQNTWTHAPEQLASLPLLSSLLFPIKKVVPSEVALLEPTQTLEKVAASTHTHFQHNPIISTFLNSYPTLTDFLQIAEPMADSPTMLACNYIQSFYRKLINTLGELEITDELRMMQAILTVTAMLFIQVEKTERDKAYLMEIRAYTTYEVYSTLESSMLNCKIESTASFVMQEKIKLKKHHMVSIFFYRFLCNIPSNLKTVQFVFSRCMKAGKRRGNICTDYSVSLLESLSKISINHRIICYLCKHISGINIHLQMQQGITCLHLAVYLAVYHDTTELLSIILNHKTFTMTSPNYNFLLTPLHLACISGNLKIVKLLVAELKKTPGLFKKWMSEKDSWGNKRIRPQDYAFSRRNTEITCYLLTQPLT